MQTNIKTIYVDMDGIKTSNEAWLTQIIFKGVLLTRKTFKSEKEAAEHYDTIVTTHSLKRPLNFYKDIL